MERVEGGWPLPPQLSGAVVALGNFDGVHLGHQAVIGRAVELARARGVPAVVATFDPHPVRWFRPGAPPFRLTTLDQRERLFRELGADASLVFAFDERLANLSPEDFAATCLHGAGGVVTGADFTFGRGRSGSVETLRELGREAGMSVDTVPPVELGGAIVSSSLIRLALAAGDCATAQHFLTRPWAIEGVVAHGDRRGRTLGYPTANLVLGDYQRPRYGIYAVRGRLPDGRLVDGAANIGLRPTFHPPVELLEAYFFDWSGDLYGQRIEVELHTHLRDEARFEGMAELQRAMDRDCERARAVLSARA